MTSSESAGCGASAPELKDSYDVVIVGGGSHGLATAYYLQKEHGITDVAILEKNYIGSGAAGRNTTILRSNYKTPEGARFYDRSVKLYEGLSQDLELQPAVLAVRPPDARALRPRDVRHGQPRRGQPPRRHRLAPDLPRRDPASSRPAMVVSDDATYPILGALYHPPGGIIRHDAVVWGFARGADSGGVEIHPYTEVLGMERTNGRVDAVRTNRGTIKAGQVLNCTAGW